LFGGLLFQQLLVLHDVERQIADAEGNLLQRFFAFGRGDDHILYVLARFIVVVRPSGLPSDRDRTDQDGPKSHRIDRAKRG
jgi:hypothetical protein